MYRKYNFANSIAKDQFKKNKRKLPIVFNYTDSLLNKDVIPAYKVDQKKKHIIFGEIVKVESEEQLQSIFDSLKKELNAMDTYKTKGISKKTFMLDFIYLTSIPLAFLIFPIKKYYLCDKSIIRKTLKDKSIIAPNHTSAYDAPFVYMSTMFTRVRMVSLVYVFKFKLVAWAFIHAGVIKYDRDKGFDLNCFRETNGILTGNGIVGLFPQGHVLKPGEPVNVFQPGLALFSLKHHAPIIPYYYKTTNRAFHVSHLIVDKPIHPDNLFGKDYIVNDELIQKYTKYLEDKFLYYETHSIEELKENAKNEESNIK